MTRADLQEKYKILGENKDISLYRKRGEYDYGMGYCGNISLQKGKAVFNGEAYSDVEALDKALREWEKGLEWPVDTYNPMIRESYRVSDRIIWFLTEKMGFERSSTDWRMNYVKNIGPDFRLSFEVEQNAGRRDEEDNVTITSKYAGYYFTQKVTDANEGVAAISAIVRESVLQMASDMVSALSTCLDMAIPNIEAIAENGRGLFGFENVDFKTTMIMLLEKELKKLKDIGGDPVGRRGRMGAVPEDIRRDAEAFRDTMEAPYDEDDICTAFEMGAMSRTNKDKE